MRSLMVMLSTAVMAAGLAGAAVAAARATAGTVEIHEFAYAPGTLTVARGTTVRWLNHDEETHTVTSTTGLFASPGLERDEAFEQRFPAPGTYQYYCSLHPKMTATVVVR